VKSPTQEHPMMEKQIRLKHNPLLLFSSSMSTTESSPVPEGQTLGRRLVRVYLQEFAHAIERALGEITPTKGSYADLYDGVFDFARFETDSYEFWLPDAIDALRRENLPALLQRGINLNDPALRSRLAQAYSHGLACGIETVQEQEKEKSNPIDVNQEDEVRTLGEKYGEGLAGDTPEDVIKWISSVSQELRDDVMNLLQEDIEDVRDRGIIDVSDENVIKEGGEDDSGLSVEAALAAPSEGDTARSPASPPPLPALAVVRSTRRTFRSRMQTVLEWGVLIAGVAAVVGGTVWKGSEIFSRPSSVTTAAVSSPTPSGVAPVTAGPAATVRPSARPPTALTGRGPHIYKLYDDQEEAQVEIDAHVARMRATVEQEVSNDEERHRLYRHYTRQHEEYERWCSVGGESPPGLPTPLNFAKNIGLFR